MGERTRRKGMKKKLLSTVLSVAMLATALAGCGSSDAATTDTSEVEDMMSTLVRDSNANYIQTSVVKSGGKTYICEEYETEMGTSKYYFDKSTEELKRIEHDNPEAKTVLIVNKFVKNPSSSYFAVPSGYKKVSAEEFNSSFEDLANSMGSIGIG